MFRWIFVILLRFISKICSFREFRFFPTFILRISEISRSVRLVIHSIHSLHFGGIVATLIINNIFDVLFPWRIQYSLGLLRFLRRVTTLIGGTTITSIWSSILSNIHFDIDKFMWTDIADLKIGVLQLNSILVNFLWIYWQHKCLCWPGCKRREDLHKHRLISILN